MSSIIYSSHGIAENLLVVLFLTLAGSQVTLASGFRLHGSVVDAATGQALTAANVVVEGSRKGAATDLDGHFVIEELGRGELRLLITHLGYASQALALSVPSQQQDGLRVELVPDAFSLNPVVVTGTRTPRFVQDVPVRTEVLTARDFEMRSAANLYEALETAPGLRVEEQCQACNFSMVRMNGLGADHTQVLMDGMPVYSGLAAVYGLEQFSSTEVDRIEIVRGAGSALYGSSAIAGAINIISERPSADAISIGLEAGDQGTRQLDASAALVRGNASLRLFAQINNEDALDETRDGVGRSEVEGKDGVSDRVQSNLRNVGANVFLSGVAHSCDELSLRLHYMNEFRYGGVMLNDQYLNPYSSGTEHIDTERTSATLGYLLPVGSKGELDLNLALVKHNRTATNDTYLNDYIVTHNGAEPAVESMRPYLATERMWVGGAHYYQTLGEHRLMAGVQVSRDEVEESGRYVIVDEADAQYGLDYTSRGEKQALDLGVMLQDEWAFAPAWELVAGLRADFHDSEDRFAATEAELHQVFESVEYDERSVNPRLALKWVPLSELTLRASFGTGFKVPFGFSEDLHLCSGSPRVWKGGDLEPERSRSFSFSADYARLGYALSLNMYATRLLGAIGIHDAGENASARGYHYEYVNVDDATVLGLDLGAEVPLYHTLKLRPSLSFFHGEYDNVREDWLNTPYEDDSRYLSRFPGLSGALRLDWIQGPWTGMLESRYTGAMYIDYAADGDLDNPGSKIHETEEMLLFSAQLGYSFPQGYRVYIGGTNLSNVLQEEKHTDDAAFVYGPLLGRSLYAGVRVSF